MNNVAKITVQIVFMRLLYIIMGQISRFVFAMDGWLSPELVMAWCNLCKLTDQIKSMISDVNWCH